MATAPALAAPPELSTEPVMGWRVWRLHAGPDGPRLMSVTRPYVWPTAEPIRACVGIYCVGGKVIGGYGRLTGERFVDMRATDSPVFVVN